MGRTMLSIFEEREFSVKAVVDILPMSIDIPFYTNILDVKEDVDIVVDFSNADAIYDILQFARYRKIPIVIATTGHGKEQLQKIREHSKNLPVFIASNMSMGIALIKKVATEIAKVLPHCDIEIVETHHNQKKDKPSGTALNLQQEIKGARININNCDIPIHSLRLGNDVGFHKIIFDTGCERIEISHQAYSRNIYAEGTLMAMSFVMTKRNGLYTMKDIL